MTPPNVPFLSVADTSLRLSLVILLLGGVRPWLRRWIGSRTLATLWLLVVARLLVPWPVASSWGWPGLLAPPEGRAPGMRGQIPSVRVSFADPARGNRTPTAKAAATPAPTASTGQGRWPGWDVWNLVWVAGAALAAGNLVRGCWQVRGWAARSPREEDDRLNRVFASLPDSHRSGVRLRITDAQDVPTLSGMIRPQIWMPRGWLGRLSDEEISHVLLHELGHVRRADLLAQWLVSLACCVHWFNPLVWMMARWARAERELACDAWVLAQGGATQRETFAAEYGGTLIKVVGQIGAETSWHHSPAAVAMAAGKRNLTLRVREIGAFRPVSVIRGRMALVVAAVAMAGFTVSRAAQTPEIAGPRSGGQATNPVQPIGSLPSSFPPAIPSPSPADHSEYPPQIEITVKIMAFSKAALAQLKAQRKESPAVMALIDQIAALLSEKPMDSTAPPGAILPEVISPENYQIFIQRMNEVSGVDLLSAPLVITKSGQKATVEIIREFFYPKAFEHNKPGSGKPELIPTNFEKTNLGLTVEFEGNLSAARDVIDLNVSFGLTELQGWLRLKDGKPVSDAERPAYDFPKIVQGVENGQPEREEVYPGDAEPVISTHTIKTFVSVAPGNTVMLSGFRRAPGTPSNLGSGDTQLNKEETVAVCFFTLNLVDAPASATGPGREKVEPSDEPTISTNKDYPYGAPAKDKPGFVTSPYAPDAGYVDLRGFKRGQEVLDPYTGKIFLVP